MRWILSVTGVVCLLMAGSAWAQPAKSEAKSAKRTVDGVLNYLLEQPPSGAVSRFSSGAGNQRGNRFDVVIHADASPAFQAFLAPGAAASPKCRRVDAGAYYCSALSKSQIDAAAQAGATWIGLLPRAFRRQGSVTSAGDGALGAAALRASLDVDGSGVMIGVISDGLVNLQDSVDAGDLPDDVQIVNGRNGDAEDNSDEGRAMAEIIHDLAPGAKLLFHTGFPSSLDMIEAIEALTAAGAHVIVDDLGFFNEPVFEDGPVAQAVEAAAAQGVVYVTAAGNSALNNYHAMYQEYNPHDGQAFLNEHDFGGGDRAMAITIEPGGRVVVFLQWADHFNGLTSTADYDLHLLDASETVSACSLAGLNGFCDSIDPQMVTTAPPVEVVFLQNTRSEAVTVNVMINRYDGDALPLQLLFDGAGFTLDEHNVAGNSIFGHPCVSDALAVGAIDASEPGFDVIEPFSSQGPCHLAFPTPHNRFKPDVIGADGVDTSLAFFAPFFGTSAAAPHVAAVAALLIELSGGPDAVSPANIRNSLRLGATDLGIAGPDSVYGHGAVDAEQAANLLQLNANTAPQSIIESPADDIVIAPGERLNLQGTCIDIEAEGQDQPLSFAWDFGGAAASTQQNPGAIPFSTPGTYTITFACADASGLSDPTPDSRAVTVNQAPQSLITSHSGSVVVEAGAQLNFTGVCKDPEHHTPYSYLWIFSGGAAQNTSTEQNPNVRYDTPGDYRVSLRCSDAFGSEASAIDSLRVLVNPRLNQTEGGGGGGGGCSLVPHAAARPLDALGNLGLPLIASLLLWMRRRRRLRDRVDVNEGVFPDSQRSW